MKEVGENNCVFWSYVYLVNGSPMAEFGVERGLKQGDPLSPFLFLMAVEGLCGLVKKAGFELMSELKVNFLKSKIYGVNVSNDFLDGASDFLYCYSAMIPFKFLGIPIGARWKNNFDKCSAI